MQNLVIKVLIVDDSILFRETIKKEISKDGRIEVVGTAEDPYDARDKIIKLQPNVLVLDVEMPKMSGIEFLKILMPQYPLPVVVVSSESRYVFEAMNAGAVDFVSKPNLNVTTDLNPFMAELMVKIKIASIAKIENKKRDIITAASHQIQTNNIIDNKVIAIGASTGGTDALYQIIEGLPNEMPGMVVVQHMPPVFTRMYAERLNNSFHYHIKEAESGDLIEKNTILIAPGDYHMQIVKNAGGYAVECLKGEKVNGHCPSVDVLFHSVAEVAKKNAVGVLLTGMGSDGAKGLLNMKKNGALTIGQDENSSVVYGMPKVAYEIGAVTEQAPLEKIPGLMYKMCCKQKKD